MFDWESILGIIRDGHRERAEGRKQMIRFTGHWDGKVIIPDEPVEIPNDQALQVTVEGLEDDGKPHSSREALLRLANEAEAMEVDLPEDLAAQHDHYLYGTPKR